nr:MAG TPA: aspartate carbamoyltransferase regulatory subunit [Caudoviricetes sp.]
MLIDNIPPGRSTRVYNAIRLTKKLIVKLKTLKDEHSN